MHKEANVYVDDMIIKSKERAGHVPTLRKFFMRLRNYNMNLKPHKCAFAVISSELLVYVVSIRRIEAELSKIKAIQEMPPLKTKKEI